MAKARDLAFGTNKATTSSPWTTTRELDTDTCLTRYSVRKTGIWEIMKWSALVMKPEYVRASAYAQYITE